MVSVSIEPLPPDRLAVRFPYDAKLIPELKAIPGHRWDPSGRCWTFPRRAVVIDGLRRVFAGWRVNLDPVLTSSSPASPPVRQQAGEADDPVQLLQREMRLRNYSHKTIKAYRSCVRSFLRYLGTVDARRVGVERIRAYLLHLMDEEGYAAASVNQVINAL